MKSQKSRKQGQKLGISPRSDIKIPRIIKYIPEILKTYYGKTDRKKLLAME